MPYKVKERIGAKQNVMSKKSDPKQSENQTCPQVKTDPKRCLSGLFAHAEKNGKVEIELALKSSA
jgi:hypothetical protein